VALLVETFGRNQASRGAWRANSETGLHRNPVQSAFKVDFLNQTFYSSHFLFPLSLRNVRSKHWLEFWAGFLLLNRIICIQMFADGIFLVPVQTIHFVRSLGLEPVHLPVPFFMPDWQGGNHD
jgi:hypothetical protein